VLVFFRSGISGLLYQVIWVRQLGNVVGNTLHSASVVTSVFMAGLGAGAFVFGRRGDRRALADPEYALRLYGKLELCIAANGLLLAFVLPRIGSIAAAAFSYVQGPHGWWYPSLASHLSVYAIAVVRIAPSTVREGINETSSALEVPGFSTALFTNGHSMSTTHPKMQRYMRAFAHLPLLQLDSPDRALVICFGVGTTLHAASTRSRAAASRREGCSRSGFRRGRSPSRWCDRSCGRSSTSSPSR
jgi:hypothetical protein